VTAEVAILGLGYVGLPLALQAAEAGHSVIGFDVDAQVVERLGNGESHVDDVTPARLRAALAAGLTLTADPQQVQAANFIICVPTPLNAQGSPDLAYVSSATQIIADQLEPGALVVLESTSYPGTTEEVVGGTITRLRGLQAGSDFALAFSPERIDPGNTQFDLSNTPKVVGGLTDDCAERADALYTSFGVDVVRAKGLREAELAKLLENTYRHVNIALMNELVKFCRALDIDLFDAIRCASSKPFGFQTFYPGPGVGGHCIPIDPNYLSFRVRSQLGQSFRFVELAQEINASMPRYVVDRVRDELNSRGVALHGARIALLGVTYKANIADRRESPADAIAELLISLGAQLAFNDPFVTEWTVDATEVDPIELSDLASVDCVLLLQAHDAFLPGDWVTATPLVVDTRGVLSGANVRGL
jgi:nucleotide sugar dehydrogenase